MPSLSGFCRAYATEIIGRIDDIDYFGADFDSRRLRSGQLFFALPGEQVDGHDFVQQASDRGAVAAVVSRRCDVDFPQIIVDDVQSCFIEHARTVRSQWRNKTVIAVTGSMGKTSSKDFLASVCALHAETFATVGNYNNMLGLSWCVHNTPENARFVILELGISEVGEMRDLADLAQPDVAWITTIAPCHLDGLSDCGVIAREKSQLFQSLAPSAIAVINDRDDYSQVFLEHSKHCRRLSLYSEHAELDESSIEFDSFARCQFSAVIGGDALRVRLSVVGKHQVFNAYGVAVIAHHLGIPSRQIMDGLCRFEGSHGRAQSYVLKPEQILLIDDCYNANPKAMYSAIESLLRVGKRHQCLVFGDMYELGAESLHWHRQVGQWASEFHIDHLLTYGAHAEAALDDFNGHAKAFFDQDALIAYLLSMMCDDMVILIKGSRSCKLEYTVQSLLRKCVSGNEVYG